MRCAASGNSQPASTFADPGGSSHGRLPLNAPTRSTSRPTIGSGTDEQVISGYWLCQGVNGARERRSFLGWFLGLVSGAGSAQAGRPLRTVARLRWTTRSRGATSERPSTRYGNRRCGGSASGNDGRNASEDGGRWRTRGRCGCRGGRVPWYRSTSRNNKSAAGPSCVSFWSSFATASSQLLPASAVPSYW